MEDQLKHGTLWNPHRHLWNQVGREMWRPGHRQESKRPCPKRDNRHHQEQRPHKQHQTFKCTKQHQVPVPSCRAVVSAPNDLLIPPSRGDIPMSEIKRPRGRPITRVLPMPGTVEYTEGCPGCTEMVTITTRSANVELPTWQPVHLAWEHHLGWQVPFQFKQRVTLPVEQQAHLM